MKNVNVLLKKAEKLLCDEVDSQVEKILLSDRNKAVAFISSMGGYCFYDADGVGMDDRAWMKPVYKLYEEYDHVFKLSGAGVHFEIVNGKVIKSQNW